MSAETPRHEQISPITRNFVERASKIVLNDPLSLAIVLNDRFLGKQRTKVIENPEIPDMTFSYAVRIFDESVAQESGIALEIQTTRGRSGSSIWEHTTTSMAFDGSKIDRSWVSPNSLLFLSPLSPDSPPAVPFEGFINDHDIMWLNILLDSLSES
jgi:hypothetical protein